MKFSLSDDSRSHLITAYAEGEFTVKGQVIKGSHIIWPTKSPVPWQLTDIRALDQQSFDLIETENVDVIIIGTGEKLVFPDDKWFQSLFERSIGVEIMDTPAACRTYNILVSEDRNILAALIPI